MSHDQENEFMANPIDFTARRKLLKSIAGGAGLVAGGALSLGAIARQASAACGLTPAQTEGPFYPVRDQPDKDWDLTFVNGRRGKALGQVVLVRGRIVDESCVPVDGALVEIWQACASGRYNHPSDPNRSAPIDPNFQYWGRGTTGPTGEYVFKTVIPGAYPANATWWRPPHLHFKVAKLGYRELTTQMYFEGEALNERDLVLLDTPAGQRDSLIARYQRLQYGDPADARAVRFDLSLRRVV